MPKGQGREPFMRAERVRSRSGRGRQRRSLPERNEAGAGGGTLAAADRSFLLSEGKGGSAGIWRGPFVLALCLLLLTGCMHRQKSSETLRQNLLSPFEMTGTLAAGGQSCTLHIARPALGQFTIEYLAPETLHGLTVAWAGEALTFRYAGMELSAELPHKRGAAAMLLALEQVLAQQPMTRATEAGETTSFGALTVLSVNGVPKEFRLGGAVLHITSFERIGGA